jgi:Arc/MetJ family transcription regulator
MRTNIEIDDKLMEAAMAAGNFKTKREAVEEGLRMIKRRKAYDALLAARGTLHWDDSDEGWAQWRAQQALQVNETEPAPYVAAAPAPVVKKAPVRATKAAPAKRGRAK